jgi:hypothetical protein
LPYIKIYGPNIESVQSALDSSELNSKEVLKYVKPRSHSSPTMSSSVSSSETVAPLTSQSQSSFSSTTMSSSATPEQVPAPLVETTPAALSQQDKAVIGGSYSKSSPCERSVIL